MNTIKASRLNQEVTKIAFIIDFVLQIVAAVVHFYVFTLLWPVFFAEEPKCDSLFLWFTFIVLTLLTILGALKICCGFFALKEYDAYVKEEEKKENN
ncbi:hypothetical protein WR25_18529 [Diploscapter pachys]|uniref:Uncharacterized protein n=1 Tax=Diploscapter pachys TaxID=2018661 RepID=A0A2A2LG99_9BILA|nr:hypothetical protein WR25_18529 [Diploscapter pachys]